MLYTSISTYVNSPFLSLSLSSPAGFATVLFAESDAPGIESSAAATAPVQVQGDNQAEFTLIVVPLTVSQYLAQPATYDNSCDRVIERTNNDPAEGIYVGHKLQKVHLREDNGNA